MEFPGEWGSLEDQKNLDKCMKFDWNFQWGWGGLRKHLFCGRGIDNFWNYTIEQQGQPKYICNDHN